MTQAITLAVLVAIILIGPPVRVRSGSGGFNTMLGVIVPPDAETEPQSPAGRLAQERGEWKLAKLFALPFAGVAAYLAPDGINAAPIALIAFALAEMAGRKLTGHWDFVGHNIEIMVAEAEGREGYREAEIARMLRGDERDMTFEQVDAKLRRWAWLARIVRGLV